MQNKLIGQLTKAHFFIVLFFSCTVHASIINVYTNNTSLIYRVRDGKIYQYHYGKKIQSTKGIEHINAIFDEAYPTFGNGQSDEVALLATHADGTLATDLVYVSHEQSTDGNIQTSEVHLKDKNFHFMLICILEHIKVKTSLNNGYLFVILKRNL